MNKIHACFKSLVPKTQIITRCLQSPANRKPLLVRSISTSKKNEDTITVSDVMPAAKPVEGTKQKRNWQSYGFDFVNEYMDLSEMHASFFWFISVGICWSAFILIYYPDLNERHWIQREAYLELRRREQLGLPLVDKNYVDPQLILATLPPDEELNDEDIII